MSMRSLGLASASKGKSITTTELEEVVFSAMSFFSFSLDPVFAGLEGEGSLIKTKAPRPAITKMRRKIFLDFILPYLMSDVIRLAEDRRWESFGSRKLPGKSKPVLR